MEDVRPSPHRLNELLAKTTRAADAASTVESPDVFGGLAAHLADILGVSATMIATGVAERPGFMHARATWLDGRLLKPFEYDLAQTPCRSVIGRQSRFVASGVHDEFAPGTMFHAKGMDSYAARSLLDSAGRQLGLIVAMDRAAVTTTYQGFGITGSFCAIAETGTLMLCSAPDSPATVSLLPETHIAIVDARRIVPGMEEAWQLARERFGDLPRSVNFISGPSRTGDIEQTIVLGAHGPYRVHLILVSG